VGPQPDDCLFPALLALHLSATVHIMTQVSPSKRSSSSVRSSPSRRAKAVSGFMWSLFRRVSTLILLLSSLLSSLFSSPLTITRIIRQMMTWSLSPVNRPRPLPRCKKADCPPVYLVLDWRTNGLKGFKGGISCRKRKSSSTPIF